MIRIHNRVKSGERAKGRYGPAKVSKEWTDGIRGV